MRTSPQTIVITGASDGIGAAAARKASRLGHRVVVVGRSPAKTEAVAAEIGAEFHVADFSELAQVARLARDLQEGLDRIDVLANNAGGLFAERRTTSDGLEQTFQVNHLAGFLLTARLMPLLTASRARVVQTSSMAARTVWRFHPEDLQTEHGYTPLKAYSRAKLANALFALELQRRHAGDGVTAASFHPGVIASNFAATGKPHVRALYANPLSRRILATSESGADRLLWLATTPEGAGWSAGAYHERNRPTSLPRRLNPTESATQLWEASERLLADRGLHTPR